MSNPYKLPRRVSFVQQLLSKLARGDSTEEDETDLAADVDWWDTRNAEEAAAVTYECLEARGAEHRECLRLANESASVWLHHLHAQVDAGYCTEEQRLLHVAKWSEKERTVQAARATRRRRAWMPGDEQ